MQRIKDVREAKGWSQEDLAKAIGTSQQQIARYEKPSSDVKASVLVKISEAMGVTISYLLGTTDNPKEISAPESIGQLSADEYLLIRYFRACTPERRVKIMDTARDQRALSEEQGSISLQYDEAV